MKLDRYWWLAGGVVLLAILVRAAIFIHVNGFDIHSQVAFRLEPDAPGYDRLAINIWQHGVFSRKVSPPLIHDPIRTPIYPAFLASVYALVGHYPAVALAVQLVVASLASGLTLLTGRELGMPVVASLFAGLVVAFDPLSALTANLMFADTVFATMMIATMWALARWRTRTNWGWLLAAVIILSLAALTRPVAQYLPLVIALWIVLAMRMRTPRAAWSKVVVSVLTVLLVCGVVLGSWAFTNYRERGVFTVSTIGTTNLLYWRAADVLAQVEGVPRHEAQNEIASEVRSIARERDLSFPEQVSLEQSIAISILRNHPALVVRQAAMGVVTLMLGPSMAPACLMLSPSVDPAACREVEFRSLSIVPKLTISWSVVLLGIVYLCSLLGIVVMVRLRASDVLILLLGVIAYFVVVSAGADAYSRMRIPFFPMMALLAGCGVWALTTVWTGRAGRFRATR